MSNRAEPLRGVRVLIVEDEAVIAQDMSELLARSGLVVVDTVATAADAIRAVHEHRPELILMDIRLKGSMDGIQAAQAIHQAMPTPVVFVTAHSDLSTLREAERAQPILYVMKPFQHGALDVIEKALRHHEESGSAGSAE